MCMWSRQLCKSSFSLPRPHHSFPLRQQSGQRDEAAFLKSRSSLQLQSSSRSFTEQSLVPVPSRSVLSQSRHAQPLKRRLAIEAAAEMAPEQTKIGFVGIGIMGLAMARNLLKAGYEVMVWNRNADKCKPLADEGAKVGESAQAVAEQSDIVFAMLADPAAALEVADSIAKGISAGKGYVDVSTIDGESAQKIHQKIKAAGGLYLEAPVSGSKQPAETGNLIFLCGGDKELFDTASPMLDIMGKAKFFLGEVGKGASMKLCVNMVMGTMMASFAEGLALADKAGLSQSDFIEVSGLGAIAAPMFGMKGPSMAAGKFPTAFPLKHQRKDIELALKYAESQKQELPVAAATAKLYKQAEAQGLGDSDFSAVLKAVEE